MPISPINLSVNARKKPLVSRKRPDFFIVGAPKCGTTALWDYLTKHPDIYMARKETHFFGSDLHFGSQFYRRSLEAYLAEFEDWEGQARVGEASVWYLFSKQAAAEIKAFSPDARIIIMLREPASMLYSLYNQFRFDGNEYLPTFEEALAAEGARAAGRRVSRLTYLLQALAYRSTACFTEQVRRYFDLFGRERVHVIIYDDMAANTPAVYRGALDFLGVASSSVHIPLGEVPGNMSVKSPTLRAFLNDPFVRGTSIALRSYLPRFLFSLLQRAGTRLDDMNRRPVKRAALADETRLSLQREFAPEIERLSALLGRDLTHWSKPELPGVVHGLRPVAPSFNEPPATAFKIIQIGEDF